MSCVTPTHVGNTFAFLRWARLTDARTVLSAGCEAVALLDAVKECWGALTGASKSEKVVDFATLGLGIGAAASHLTDRRLPGNGFVARIAAIVGSCAEGFAISKVRRPAAPSQTEATVRGALLADTCAVRGTSGKAVGFHKAVRIVGLTAAIRAARIFRKLRATAVMELRVLVFADATTLAAIVGVSLSIPAAPTVATRAGARAIACCARGAAACSARCTAAGTTGRRSTTKAPTLAALAARGSSGCTRPTLAGVAAAVGATLSSKRTSRGSAGRTSRAGRYTAYARTRSRASGGPTAPGIGLRHTDVGKTGQSCVTAVRIALAAFGSGRAAVIVPAVAVFGATHDRQESNQTTERRVTSSSPQLSHGAKRFYGDTCATRNEARGRLTHARTTMAAVRGSLGKRMNTRTRMPVAHHWRDRAESWLRVGATAAHFAHGSAPGDSLVTRSITKTDGGAECFADCVVLQPAEPCFVGTACRCALLADTRAVLGTSVEPVVLDYAVREGRLAGTFRATSVLGYSWATPIVELRVLVLADTPALAAIQWIGLCVTAAWALPTRPGARRIARTAGSRTVSCGPGGRSCAAARRSPALPAVCVTTLGTSAGDSATGASRIAPARVAARAGACGASELSTCRSAGRASALTSASARPLSCCGASRGAAARAARVRNTDVGKTGQSCVTAVRIALAAFGSGRAAVIVPAVAVFGAACDRQESNQTTECRVTSSSPRLSHGDKRFHGENCATRWERASGRLIDVAMGPTIIRSFAQKSMRVRLAPAWTAATGDATLRFSVAAAAAHFAHGCCPRDRVVAGVNARSQARAKRFADRVVRSPAAPSSIETAGLRALLSNAGAVLSTAGEAIGLDYAVPKVGLTRASRTARILGELGTTDTAKLWVRVLAGMAALPAIEGISLGIRAFTNRPIAARTRGVSRAASVRRSAIAGKRAARGSRAARRAFPCTPAAAAAGPTTRSSICPAASSTCPAASSISSSANTAAGSTSRCALPSCCTSNACAWFGTSCAATRRTSQPAAACTGCTAGAARVRHADVRNAAESRIAGVRITRTAQCSCCAIIVIPPVLRAASRPHEGGQAAEYCPSSLASRVLHGVERFHGTARSATCELVPSGPLFLRDSCVEVSP